MSRVKRGIVKSKKRRKILKLVKGFRDHYRRKKKFAKEALLHAFKYSYIGRKQKKRSFRRLWQIRINSYLRSKGYKYSEFIYKLGEKDVNLNRKVLSQLAQKSPHLFDKVLAEVYSS